MARHPGSAGADDAPADIRDALAGKVAARQEALIALTQDLVAARSENPPGDTRAAARVAVDFLRTIPAIEVQEIESAPAIANVVARLHGRRPGRRLVFSAHLDTYPAGDPASWTNDPFTAVRAQGRLHGRGVSDMKAGMACSLMAMALLAECREAWDGEIVALLAGDEETMGERGTAFLLDTLPHARGDVVICGDAGSPRVLRFGEKGLLWLDVHAHGRAAHGAHVHRGINAVERLMHAIGRLFELRTLVGHPPAEVAAAMRSAQAVSESLSGEGETATLETVTVNCGALHGGTSANLVPDTASASLDIRLPLGVTVAQVEAAIAARLDGLDGIRYEITRRYEATCTAPSHEILAILTRCGTEALGAAPVSTLRVGASDTRLFRQRGIAAVVCGLTPHQMGGPDEYITLDELAAVSHMHTLAAFDYLSPRPPGPRGRSGRDVRPNLQAGNA